MTRNSQHGTQKPSAWYALGLKINQLTGHFDIIELEHRAKKKQMLIYMRKF